jgi:Ser/Thr protein kinase RdoA (MazF antagonist)
MAERRARSKASLEGPLYSTLKESAVARLLADRYNLALPLECRLLNRGFNDVYRAVAATGERRIFRLSHHRARGAADVATETAFLAHLDLAGVPVAAPVATREGALHMRARSAEGEREGVLFRDLGGRAPDMTSAADARANGVTLAKMHEAAKSFRAEAALYRLDLDHLLRKPLARIRESGLIEDASRIADLEAVASRTAHAIEARDLTWTHCHGDCHGFNARILDGGVAAFFDFDDGGSGYLAYDLAVFLGAKVSFGRRLHAMWHAFLGGYRSVRPIAEADFEAAHDFVIVRHIWLMGEYASRAREWGCEPVSWIGREVDFLKSWEERRAAALLFGRSG